MQSKGITPLRILVVEDDVLIASLLSDMLAEMGHKVCAVAATEAEAVVSAEVVAPDLVIADARLRVGSGIAAVRRMLLCGPVAHIFVTGERRLAVPQGAPLLLKPFTRAALVHAIDRVLAPEMSG
jgi:CheY-like chemotaxis protein